MRAKIGRAFDGEKRGIRSCRVKIGSERKEWVSNPKRSHEEVKGFRKVASEESSFSKVANKQRWKELAIDMKNMTHA